MLGSNDPCSCGSGKKYSHCCEGKVSSLPREPASIELNKLGALLNSGRYADLESQARSLVGLYPNSGFVWELLGISLQMQGKESLHAFQKTAELLPNDAGAQYNLGAVLKDHGRFNDAAVSYRNAIKIKPDYAEAHCNLGNILRDLGQLDNALASYRFALKIKPNLAEVYLNMGGVLADIWQLNDAVASYRRALEIKPDYAVAYSNMLYLHAFTRNISPELELNLAANWEVAVLNESERVAARKRTFDYPPRDGRKLRIGVVSAEIGQHAVAEFLEPFLEQLDRSRFHVTLFPTTARLEPRVAQLRKLADEFISLVGYSDKKAADIIRSDLIDILIDTTSHMKDCRLGIFAHRAAPVQCHYIGYHGTTGLTEMDWFIADEVLLPSTFDAHFREGIWRLPRLWIAYRGDASLPESRWKPSPDGTVWLGSFNNSAKVSEGTLVLWAKVMNAIPESKLFLKDGKASDKSVQERIRMVLHRHGIAAERVEFSGRVTDWRLHMALYDRLDIALDTIPLNSGTTAFDALWMGVPLIGLEGNWMGARMTCAILRALGKPEWIARNEDEYVSIVAALARDVEGRKSLRDKQRSLMAGSPLCDAKDLTRSLENAFETMFERWLKRRVISDKESLNNEKP
jgi:predicted O-linked N-acetylglucosamine transferase (SPINDLY family)